MAFWIPALVGVASASKVKSDLIFRRQEYKGKAGEERGVIVERGDAVRLKTAVVIPCYREEQNIADVVKRAKQFADAVVVSDDKSLDCTLQEAEKAGALCCTNYEMKGAGANTLNGIRYALKNTKADILVTLDGDGQHNPEDIPKIIEPIQFANADIVFGIRSWDALPRYRFAGNSIISFVQNLGYNGNSIPDVTCGFRAYRASVARHLLTTEPKFGFLFETINKARACGFSIAKVPVSCFYHEELYMNSSMHPLKMGIGMVLSAAKWRLKTEVFR
jgi:glycosyltransferase involved in cell wall biosynthesis